MNTTKRSVTEMTQDEINAEVDQVLDAEEFDTVRHDELMAETGRRFQAERQAKVEALFQSRGW